MWAWMMCAHTRLFQLLNLLKTCQTFGFGEYNWDIFILVIKKAANNVRILQILCAAFQPNWPLLSVSAPCNPWLLIRYHVKLSFTLCLTYLICCIPNALLPLISRKQLGWGHLPTGFHLGWSNPIDFTHGAILLCCFSEAAIPQVCPVRAKTGV